MENSQRLDAGLLMHGQSQGKRSQRGLLRRGGFVSYLTGRSAEREMPSEKGERVKVRLSNGGG